jgi:hypothetical protein
MCKLIALLVTLAVVSMPSAAAAAKPRPGHAKIASHDWSVPRPAAQPGTVWVSAEPGLGTFSGVYASGFWNQRTGRTDFIGQLTPDGLGWANTPCPANVHAPCLRVVWGNLAQGVYAKYDDTFCTGRCTRRGVITVNRWGPYFCDDNVDCPYPPMFGDSNPWNHGTVVTHHFGRFIGLATHPAHDCASVMSASAWTCPAPRAGESWLTAAEAAHVAGW